MKLCKANIYIKLNSCGKNTVMVGVHPLKETNFLFLRMIFNSYVFLFYFLPLVIVLCYAVHRMPKAPLLLISSYLFYGWWRPEYMLLMFFFHYGGFFCRPVAGERIYLIVKGVGFSLFP